MFKVVRKSQGSVFKIKCFVGQKSISRHYYIQHVKDGIQVRVNKIYTKKA